MSITGPTPDEFNHDGENREDPAVGRDEAADAQRAADADNASVAHGTAPAWLWDEAQDDFTPTTVGWYDFEVHFDDGRPARMLRVLAGTEAIAVSRAFASIEDDNRARLLGR